MVSASGIFLLEVQELLMMKSSKSDTLKEQIHPFKFAFIFSL